MDIDARTKETATTLLGVAALTAGNPTSSEIRPEWDADGTSTVNLAGAVVDNAQNAIPSPTPQPFSTPGGTVYATPYHASNSSMNVPQHSQATSVYPPPGETNTLLSMSSIGFGIDSSASASWGDATEAAVRALQDAMERSTLRLPMNMPTQHLLQIKVQLGVPPKQVGSGDPMVVDVSRLTCILPRAIPVLPIRVVVGGLFLRGETQGSPSVCTAVACITLQSHAPRPVAEVTVPGSVTQAAASARASPWASLESHQSPGTMTSIAPLPDSTAANSNTVLTSSSASAVPSSVGGTMATGPAHTTTAESQAVDAVARAPVPVAVKQKVHRSTSIEMLAMISEEIRLAGDKGRTSASSTVLSEGDTASGLSQHFPVEFTPSEACDHVTTPDAQLGDDGQLRNGNYNYKKLPPGVTTKNNRRLFVKHNYRDYSGEQPLPEESDLVGSTNSARAARTPNAAFPLKLHETLTQIEMDGHGDIIGWMPHGRSFKIHKQKEFAEIVLPRYFVMTKKSSFLRQLNLYGFNRFSAGPDQGSYYHEKFLRGLKFLCRRMTRQKVNGNRIRSAGNPDEEPALLTYPSCPPPSVSEPNPPFSNVSNANNFAYVSREEDDEGDKDDVENPDDEQHEICPEDYSSPGPAQRNSGGSLVSFPLKLQRMLDKLEAESDCDAISWSEHGRAFVVHDSEAFVSRLMPAYFNQTKFSSFQRQLHMYNFQRITTGRDKGAYHNPNFLRGHPNLCTRMVRTRVNGKGCRKPGDPDSEPNLHILEKIPPIESGANIRVPVGNLDVDDGDDSVGV